MSRLELSETATGSGSIVCQLIASPALLPLGSQRQAGTPSACAVCEQRLELPAGQRRVCCLAKLSNFARGCIEQ